MVSVDVVVVVVGVFTAKSAELSCFRDRRDVDGVYPKVHTYTCICARTYIDVHCVVVVRSKTPIIVNKKWQRRQKSRIAYNGIQNEHIRTIQWQEIDRSHQNPA